MYTMLLHTMLLQCTRCCYNVHNNVTMHTVNYAYILGKSQWRLPLHASSGVFPGQQDHVQPFVHRTGLSAGTSTSDGPSPRLLLSENHRSRQKRRLLFHEKIWNLTAVKTACHTSAWPSIVWGSALPPPKKTQKKNKCAQKQSARTSCLCSPVLISTQESNGDEDKFFKATNKPKQTVGWIQCVLVDFTLWPLQPCHNTPFQWHRKTSASLGHLFSNVTTLHFNYRKTTTMLHSATSSAMSQHSISMIQKNQCVTLLYLQLCHI